MHNLEAENARLREQIEVLKNAYAEAVVIIAKWSPGGMEELRKTLGMPPA